MFAQRASMISQKVGERAKMVGIIGSTSFWDSRSQNICVEIGANLAKLKEVHLITGGMTGVAETVGRSFNSHKSKEQKIIHVLPQSSRAWDFGQTYFEGRDMAERRGGPGTVHEADIATKNKAVLVPVGRTGGCAAELFKKVPKPANVDQNDWDTLNDDSITSEEVGALVKNIVERLV